jgi:hypothetical protein
MREGQVYEATDGTSVNLYHWNNKWWMSTKRGYDAASNKIRGRSIEESFFEALARANGVTNANQLYEGLDKSYIYNISFSTPECHPISNYAFRLLSVFRNEHEFTEDESALRGLWPKDYSNITFGHKLVNEPRLNDMLNVCNNSMTEYINTGASHMGYIIVANNGNRYYLESQLAKNLREVIYNVPRMYLNNKYFISIRSLIIPEHKRIIHQLMPEVSKMHARILNEVVPAAVNKILYMERSISGRYESSNTDKFTAICKKIMVRMRDENVRLDVMSKVASHIITSFILTTGNIDLLIDLMVIDDQNN